MCQPLVISHDSASVGTIDKAINSICTSQHSSQQHYKVLSNQLCAVVYKPYVASWIEPTCPLGSHPGVYHSVFLYCHKPRYWSATDRYRATLLQGKQAQDMSLWFPYRFMGGQTAGNSRGHSPVQSPKCGNEFNQAWESCTTTGWSGDHITQEKWYDFQGN